MAKAINWPKEFLSEIMSEHSGIQRIALRLGSIYFDNGYYAPDEIIDIRVDHKIVKKGQIIGDMKLLKIKDISDDLLSLNKSGLKKKENTITFLSKNYEQQVDENTTVTVITYINIPSHLDDQVDDPHC